MLKTIQPNEAFISGLIDLPLFQCLNPNQRRTLLACSVVVGCDPGDVIFNEGDPADTFYILKCGRVKMRRMTTSGKEVVLHLSAPPHMIGCKGLTMPGSRYPADAVAVDKVIALGFGREKFLAQVAHIPDVFFSLLIELNRRLIDFYSLQANALEPIEKRIATLLLNQASGQAADFSEHDLKPVFMTKGLIANIVGTTTETAIRILSRWKKSGLIRSERGKITILDVKEICRIAEMTCLNPEVPKTGFEV